MRDIVGVVANRSASQARKSRLAKTIANSFDLPHSDFALDNLYRASCLGFTAGENTSNGLACRPGIGMREDGFREFARR
ncbi:hypothetical protein [Burkholderia perseverans]|uniref:hypothetical protein n=1 Tax=Burkholderia perseverans TaxID=2615214 RepID=UPI001FEDB308|nr:hypothetical protein [Burkholderia perseverans]